MAKKIKASEFPVLLAQQGQNPKSVMVSSGATVRTVLTAAGLNADALAGSVTLDGASIELSARVKRDDYLAYTPKAAGGR